jgi:TRAP-type C4-dicarboxylate transport system permease small subunit
MAPTEQPRTTLQRAARGFERAAGVVSRVSLRVAGAACLATFALVCYAISMRYFFNKPQSWSDEAVGWLIVVTVMLALPEAQRRGEHIGVDALTERLSARHKRWAAAFGVVTVAVCGWLLLSEGIEMVQFTRMIGIVSNVLPEVDLWLIQAFVPLGGAILLLVAAAQLACYFAGLEPASTEKTKPDALE